MSDTEQQRSVIVIGAGISGLYGAHLLTQRGVRDVIVLEAQSEIGGRVQSTLQDDGRFELGGQWIHGLGNNPMWKFITEHDVSCNFIMESI